MSLTITGFRIRNRRVPAFRLGRLAHTGCKRILTWIKGKSLASRQARLPWPISFLNVPSPG